MNFEVVKGFCKRFYFSECFRVTKNVEKHCLRQTKWLSSKKNTISSDFLIFQWKNREMWREKYGGPKKHQKSEREKHLLVNLSQSANARAISCCFVRFKVDNKLPVLEKKVKTKK